MRMTWFGIVSVLAACGEDSASKTDADSGATTTSPDTVDDTSIDDTSPTDTATTGDTLSPGPPCLEGVEAIDWPGVYSEGTVTYPVTFLWEIEGSELAGEIIWGFRDPPATSRSRGIVLADDSLAWHDFETAGAVTPWYYHGWMPSCGVLVGVADGDPSPREVTDTFATVSDDNPHAALACMQAALAQSATWTNGVAVFQATELGADTLTGSLASADQPIDEFVGTLEGGGWTGAYTGHEGEVRIEVAGDCTSLTISGVDGALVSSDNTRRTRACFDGVATWTGLFDTDPQRVVRLTTNAAAGADVTLTFTDVEGGGVDTATATIGADGTVAVAVATVPWLSRPLTLRVDPLCGALFTDEPSSTEHHAVLVRSDAWPTTFAATCGGDDVPAGPAVCREREGCLHGTLSIVSNPDVIDEAPSTDAFDALEGIETPIETCGVRWHAFDAGIPCPDAAEQTCNNTSLGVSGTTAGLPFDPSFMVVSSYLYFSETRDAPSGFEGDVRLEIAASSGDVFIGLSLLVEDVTLAFDPRGASLPFDATPPGTYTGTLTRYDGSLLTDRAEVTLTVE